MEQHGGGAVHGFQTREDAERAAIARLSREHRPLYVCKDNNGRWHITSHPEYFKDAYRVRPPSPSEQQG